MMGDAKRWLVLYHGVALWLTIPPPVVIKIFLESTHALQKFSPGSKSNFLKPANKIWNSFSLEILWPKIGEVNLDISKAQCHFKISYSYGKSVHKLRQTNIKSSSIEFVLLRSIFISYILLKLIQGAMLDI